MYMYVLVDTLEQSDWFIQTTMAAVYLYMYMNQAAH